ncbi:MAG: RNA methyltransferase [Gracilimonas sp.]|nr:RNA methyltransferase [Gracilimonas sp.]
MDPKTKKELIKYLRDFTTESRWNKIRETVQERTRHISVVVEDIYQPHNASAVLRSCDGFGIQDVHIIENKNEFEASSQVTIGADQWLSLYRYNAHKKDNTASCFTSLKESGYQVIATSPHKNDINLNDLDITQKTALVFGSEIDGISDKATEMADGFLKIPMYGFSESFNISVSAAICLYNITRRLRNSDISWKLGENEMDEIMLQWLRQSIRAGEKLQETFLKQAK